MRAFSEVIADVDPKTAQPELREIVQSTNRSTNWNGQLGRAAQAV
jgi:hypothetical protein